MPVKSTTLLASPPGCRHQCPPLTMPPTPWSLAAKLHPSCRPPVSTKIASALADRHTAIVGYRRTSMSCVSYRRISTSCMWCVGPQGQQQQVLLYDLDPRRLILPCEGSNEALSARHRHLNRRNCLHCQSLPRRSVTVLGPTALLQ